MCVFRRCALYLLSISTTHATPTPLRASTPNSTTSILSNLPEGLRLNATGPTDFYAEPDWDDSLPEVPNRLALGHLTLSAIAHLALSPYTDELPAESISSPDNPGVAILLKGEGTRIMQTRYQLWALQLCYSNIAPLVHSRRKTPLCNFGTITAGRKLKLGMLQFVKSKPEAIAYRDDNFEHALSNSTSSLHTAASGLNGTEVSFARQTITTAYLQGLGIDLALGVVDIVRVLTSIILEFASNAQLRARPLEWQQSFLYGPFFDGNEEFSIEVALWAGKDRVPASYEEVLDGIVAILVAMREAWQRYRECLFSVERVGDEMFIMLGSLVTVEEDVAYHVVREKGQPGAPLV